MGGKAGTAGTLARSTKSRSVAARKPTRRRTMTPAALAANKRNAQKAGRPKKHRYEEVFADLVVPPEGDPLAICLWAQRIAAHLVVETLKGRGNQKLNADVRTTLGLILRAVPAERLAEVEKRIARVTKAKRSPRLAKGPPVESRNPATPTVRG